MDQNLEEKLAQLAENEEFCEKLAEVESTEDVIKLFAEYGVEITEDELEAMLAEVPVGELDEMALEDVAGGIKLWWWLIGPCAPIFPLPKLPRKQGKKK